ncbi:MAG: hypothetical protein HOJ34_05870 [Kordiimonadaceae bacterium]|nr:hypothetical protein [Kordiimonadaceae bacterium]MBT6037098.1 hypothetical protein [Kordiimonadaceae bacterium]MBT6329293.1 hypothetical protein [Kordiimonadaceae bacterium]
MAITEVKYGVKISSVIKYSNIPSDKLDEIATPFIRHQPNPHIAYDGMGLGLSISKSLAELHGGSLAIKSKENEGTTISVTIPTG